MAYDIVDLKLTSIVSSLSVILQHSSADTGPEEESQAATKVSSVCF